MLILRCFNWLFIVLIKMEVYHNGLPLAWEKDLVCLGFLLWKRWVSSPGCSFDFVLQASIPNIASGRKKQECAKIPMRCQLTHEVELNLSVYNLWCCTSDCVGSTWWKQTMLRYLLSQMFPLDLEHLSKQRVQSLPLSLPLTLTYNESCQTPVLSIVKNSLAGWSKEGDGGRRVW